MAIAILAMALIPIFGLISGGLVQTDMSVTYTTAVELSKSVMNQLLSPEIPFDSLPLSAAAAYPAPGGPPADFGGNVAGSAAFDSLFGEEWDTHATFHSRTKTLNGITYHVFVWIGNYGAQDDIQFNFYQAPIIDWSQSTTSPFYYNPALQLTAADVASGFSPYLTAGSTPSAQIASHTTATWASDLILVDHWSRSEPTTSGGDYRNFVKITVLTMWQRRDAKGDFHNQFPLVSFRANLRR